MAVNRRRRAFLKRATAAVGALVLALLVVSLLVGSFVPFYAAVLVLVIAWIGYLLREAFLDARQRGETTPKAILMAPVRVLAGWFTTSS